MGSETAGRSDKQPRPTRPDPLTSLSELEADVASLLDTAGKAMAQLSQSDNPQNAESFSHLASHYMRTLKNLESTLKVHIINNADVRPFETSSYGARSDLELTYSKTALLHGLISRAIDRGIVTEPQPP